MESAEEEEEKEEGEARTPNGQTPAQKRTWLGRSSVEPGRSTERNLRPRKGDEDEEAIERGSRRAKKSHLDNAREKAEVAGEGRREKRSE